MSTNSIPYGGLISSSGTLAGANTMRFSSKPAIFSTTGSWGFYYYGYRFYDPGMQRWLNRDPLGEEGFQALSPHQSNHLGDGQKLYSFVGNDLLNRYDLMGLKVQICCRGMEVNWVVNATASALHAKHCWIKTDSQAAGMGPAAGGSLPKSPCCGTLTAIVDHSSELGAKCVEIPGADEGCVNNALTVGKALGEWGLQNNCNSFAQGLVRRCGGKNPCLRWRTIHIPPHPFPTKMCDEFAVSTDFFTE